MQPPAVPIHFSELLPGLRGLSTSPWNWGILDPYSTSTKLVRGPMMQLEPQHLAESLDLMSGALVTCSFRAGHLLVW